MFYYIIKRLIAMLPVLVLVSLIVFTIIHLTPGDPALIMLGEEATPQALAALRHELGLDQPLPIQYLVGSRTSCAATWAARFGRISP